MSGEDVILPSPHAEVVLCGRLRVVFSACRPVISTPIVTSVPQRSRGLQCPCRSTPVRSQLKERSAQPRVALRTSPSNTDPASGQCLTSGGVGRTGSKTGLAPGHLDSSAGVAGRPGTDVDDARLPVPNIRTREIKINNGFISTWMISIGTMRHRIIRCPQKSEPVSSQ